MKITNESLKSTLDPVTLNGTLVSLPDSKAAVLFIAGSGHIDRDVTSEGNITFSGKQEKLFRQLADEFTRKNISSFRYDKRGVLNEKGEYDKEEWKKTDREHLIQDAYDAAKFMLSKLGLEKENGR